MIDGVPIPVLEGSWSETPRVPGSRGFTETGVVRSVRSGRVRLEFAGTAMFTTRAEAVGARNLFCTAGDHAATGRLIGPDAVIVEIDCGDLTAVPHRPVSGPTAMWQIEFRLIESP